jgi:hypothetical protein
MIFRHAWIGGIGILDLGKTEDFFIGDPIPDIVIHSIFVVSYVIGITYLMSQNKSKTAEGVKK